MKIDKHGAHPKTEEELTGYLRELADKPQDYNSSAEGLRDGTVACFNYLASLFGVTGFQASWAILGALGTINGYDGPYGVLKADDMLYPQYGTASERAAKMEASWHDWLAEEARKRLKEHPEVVWKTVTDDDGENPIEIPNVAPRVHEHWKRLAGV